MNNYNRFYCPYCNSILDLQNTFDHNNNVHICEECGNMVIDSKCNDKNICRCSECNDILNNQISWVGETGKPYRCFNCGAINYLPSVDDYIEEEFVEEYNGPLCPSCNGPLGSDYDKNKNINICPNCGIEIKSLKCKDKFVWYCKQCGDLMNNQSTWRGEYEKIYRCSNCECTNELLGPKTSSYTSSNNSSSSYNLYNQDVEYKSNKKESYNEMVDYLCENRVENSSRSGGVIRTLAAVFSWLGGILTAIIIWFYFVSFVYFYEMNNAVYWIPIVYSIIDFIILIWREVSVSNGKKTVCGVFTLIFCSLIGGVFTLCIPERQLG